MRGPAVLPAEPGRPEYERHGYARTDEAVYVIKTLVRPRTAMPTHVNEQATSGGAVRAGTRVDYFTMFVRDYVNVVVPLSDVARAFDGSGRCIGCR